MVEPRSGVTLNGWSPRIWVLVKGALRAVKPEPLLKYLRFPGEPFLEALYLGVRWYTAV